MNKDKNWERANKFGKSEVVEWNRLLENPELRNEIQNLQKQFRLPLSFVGDKFALLEPVYFDWMGWTGSEDPLQSEKDVRRKKMLKEADRLQKKYDIHSQYFGTLWFLIFTGESENSYQSKGFPRTKYEPNEDGEWVPECIVTPETDLGNPLVLDFIKRWQDIYRTKPPHPIKRGKRKDWRPTWEWSHRHPDVTHKEIADMLGCDRVTVSRNFSRLDKEYATK